MELIELCSKKLALAQRRRALLLLSRDGHAEKNTKLGEEVGAALESSVPRHAFYQTEVCQSAVCIVALDDFAG